MEIFFKLVFLNVIGNDENGVWRICELYVFKFFFDIWIDVLFEEK